MNDITRHAPSLPGLEASHETRAILDRFQIEMQDHRTPALNRLPTKEERAALQQRNYDLRRLLRPAQDATADMDTARRLIAMMLNGYTSIRNKSFRDDSERKAWLDEQIASYLLHLQELPVFAIARACDDVTNDRIPGLDVDWPPTTPRMVKAVREKIERLSAEQWKVDAILSANKTMRADVSQEQRERMVQGFKDLRASLPTFEDVFTAEERSEIDRRHREGDQRSRIREWTALGLEPKVFSDGSVASVALERSLGNPDILRVEAENRRARQGGDVDKAIRKQSRRRQ